MFDGGYVREGKKRSKGRGGNVQNSWFTDIVMLIA